MLRKYSLVQVLYSCSCGYASIYVLSREETMYVFLQETTPKPGMVVNKHQPQLYSGTQLTWGNVCSLTFLNGFSAVS